MADVEAFENGVRAFCTGDFARSLTLFEAVRRRNARDSAAAYYRERAAAAVQS